MCSAHHHRSSPTINKQLLIERVDIYCVSMINKYSTRNCLSGYVRFRICEYPLRGLSGYAFDKAYVFRLIRQGRALRLGVPYSLPSLPVEVSMLKLDFSQSYWLSGLPSGNHHPWAAQSTRGSMPSVR